MAAPQHRDPGATLDFPPPTTASPLGCLDGALARLADRYELRPSDAVAGYLRRHADLVPVLLEAANVIPRYFGVGAPLALEVYIDPEDEDSPPELFVLIRTGMATEDALDQLRRLIDDWWFAAVPDGPGRLVVDFERD